jgi:hypothetical protein
MQSDAAKLVSHDFAFPCVQTGTDRDPKGRDGIRNRAGTAYGASRAVKGSEKPISRSVDLTATEVDKLAAHHGVICVEQVTPAAIAEARSPLSGLDDVGKQYGCHYAIGLWATPRTSKKLCDLVQNGVRVTQIRGVVNSGEINQFRPGDALCHVTAAPNVKEPVVHAV